MMRAILVAALAALVPASLGGIVYENDLSGFNAAIAGLTQGTINWDDVTLPDNSAYTTITGSYYNGLFGSPTLAVDRGDLYVGDPDQGFFTNDFVAVSSSNVFAPASSGSPQGILTITFDRPMYFIGAWFLDVEGDYANTGLSINGTLYAFSQNQGDDSQSFLGVFDRAGFTSVDIHMSSN